MDKVAQLAEKKGIKRICDFVESAWFILAFGAATFLFYAFNLPLMSVAIFAICGTFICLFCEDTRPGLALVFLILFSLQYKGNLQAYLSVGAIVLYAIAAPVVLAAMAYRLICRRVPVKGKFGVISIALFSVAFLLGGLFSNYLDVRNLLYVTGKAASLMGCYLFFSLTLKHREDNFVYIAKVFAVSICVIALELLLLYIRKYEWGTPLDVVWKKKIVLGWAVSNTIAEMIVFGLPAVFYLIYKEEKGYLYWIVVAVGMLAVYFTFGRNALLWGAITTVAGSVVNCFLGRNKKINRIVVLVAVAALAILVVVFCWNGYIEKIARFFLDVKFDDSNRFNVWKEHFALFLEYPVFGVGFSAYRKFSYVGHTAHNLWLQMLSSTGLVGFALFMVHHVWTFRLLGKKPTLDRAFIFGCVLVGILMSVLSPLFFPVYFMIPYTALLVLLEKSKVEKAE